jgi:hypothetical protein
LAGNVLNHYIFHPHFNGRPIFEIYNERQLPFFSNFTIQIPVNTFPGNLLQNIN